ncbi:MAG TPA: hypothetical protein VM869_23920 [Enhygromyxa sp.]|nr:hypothetical protein [Enhygromyxa sp.]
MRHIPCSSIVVVSLLSLPACGPGGFTAQALDSESSDASSDVQGELDESEVEDDGWDVTEEDEGDVDTDTDEPGEDEADDEDDGDGDGDNDGLPDGSACTGNLECASLQCDVIPFLGGLCGECNEDSDCVDGGCTSQNPFALEPSKCNFGELGGGCQSDVACMPGLECSTVFNLLGVIELNTCSECLSDGNCLDGQICVPVFDFPAYGGARTCMPPNSLPSDAYCDLENDGDLACASTMCSPADVMGLAQIGACGECKTDADCGAGTCIPATFDLNTAEITGSLCDSP